MSAGSVGFRSAGSLRRCSQLAGCQTMKTQSIFAAASFSGSRFGASQKLWPVPSWTTTRLVFTSILAKSARTAFSALASPRHSACHWPPPKGGPSHQAMRPGWLKIAAAPCGPAGIGDRLVARIRPDQRECLPRGGDRQDGDQETRRDSGHGIPRERTESHTEDLRPKAEFLGAALADRSKTGGGSGGWDESAGPAGLPTFVSPVFRPAFPSRSAPAPNRSPSPSRRRRIHASFGGQTRSAAAPINAGFRCEKAAPECSRFVLTRRHDRRECSLVRPIRPLAKGRKEAL